MFKHLPFCLSCFASSQIELHQGTRCKNHPRSKSLALRSSCTRRRPSRGSIQRRGSPDRIGWDRTFGLRWLQHDDQDFLGLQDCDGEKVRVRGGTCLNQLTRRAVKPLQHTAHVNLPPAPSDPNHAQTNCFGSAAPPAQPHC